MINIHGMESQIGCDVYIVEYQRGGVEYIVCGPMTINEKIVTYRRAQGYPKYVYGFSRDGITFPASVYGKTPKDIFIRESDASRSATLRNRLRRDYHHCITK